MFDNIILSVFCRLTSAWERPALLALSPGERWQAASKGTATQTVHYNYMPIILSVILVLLVLVLIRVSISSIKRERRRNQAAFEETIHRLSLSTRENQLLQEIARESGLRHSNAIFQQPAAFERGVDRLLAKLARESQDPAKKKRINAEIGFLRDKLRLGDMIIAPPAVVEESSEKIGRKRSRLTTRDLPLNKLLHITRRESNRDDDFHGTIVANTDEQLELQIETPIKISFGEIWHARYHFGASVWEFETTVISYDGDRLVLQHNQNVRFVNRRRFLRVPSEHLAFIAHYPFLHIEKTEADAWAPVTFQTATVTELAGPGLRLETPLAAKSGDRVLVAFRMEMPADSDQAGKGCVIETMGEVKRVEPMYDRYAMAIHLMGLKDSDIDYLVRLTNQAIYSAGIPKKQDLTQARPEQIEQDEVLEMVFDASGDTHV
jgi:hypothetical protein